jgi:hypothetical protein
MFKVIDIANLQIKEIQKSIVNSDGLESLKLVLFPGHCFLANIYIHLSDVATFFRLLWQTFKRNIRNRKHFEKVIQIIGNMRTMSIIGKYPEHEIIPSAKTMEEYKIKSMIKI